MKGRKFFFLLILSFLPAFLIAEISFHGLDLSNDGRLLFKTEFETASDVQHALFVSTLANMSMQQLTAFPEKIQVVDNGRTILAINRFGAVKIPVSGGLPSALPVYPSFSEGNIPLKGRLQELAASADGKWILYIEPVSPAYGNLLLIEANTGEKWVISEQIELPASDFPAKWSPDSRLFVYSKNGRLYYFPIISDLSVLVDERFRMIGQGGINSVFWGSRGEFYYFMGNTLYRINNPQLFTRTIYGDFLSIGSVEALFPFDFDSGFDRYWIAPDSGSILINKNEKGVFIFTLGEYQNSMSVLPYAAIPFGSQNINVLWSLSGQLAVISSMENENIIWRFEITENQIRNITSDITDIPSFSGAALSPNGSRAAFWGENGLEIRDTANWRLIHKLGSEKVYSCVWIDNNRLVSGNSSFIEELNISGTNITQRRICLSDADEFGFEAGASSRILARKGVEWFANDGKSPWVLVNNPQLRQPSLASERYRVYLETQSSGYFKNVPMIRSISSTNTVPLVSGFTINSAFTQRPKTQIALCFDLYDDDAGLQTVLAALRRYNLRATFFMNGDFIRRNPHAAAAIAKAGHEAASMFYAPIDFSDSRYRITQEFITQGLARNEDEFYHATGKDLSLLWHPPFYRGTNFISNAASASGYITVERTIDLRDWLSKEDAVRFNMHQIPASQMIEEIVNGELVPNQLRIAVIPIRLGMLPGGREDYLFQRIDVLLDALIRKGYEIVPVSTGIAK